MIADKTLRTLEYTKILERLETHAGFSASKEAVRALKPATDLDVAREFVAQTSEAAVLLEARPSLHLGGAHDVRGAVRRAEVGAILTPTELLDIGGTLGAGARFRSALKGDLQIPWMRHQGTRMAENRDLIEAIDQTFSERGEVLDSASPALRRIRSDIHAAQGRLMDRLNSMVTSEYRTALQESIVTMRNGRYVIPVKQDSRSKVPGIVHDQSASGQTVFVEPLAVTEMNNRLKELQLDEEREIERILQALSTRVAQQGRELHDTVEALSSVDLSFAKAKYAQVLGASAPKLNDTGRIAITAARHPLLHGDVVPISLWLGADFRVLVITGPNTGGKTVALKTVGLLTLMAQSGMHIPADPQSEISIFPKIFADIGDEQSIEQSLSTFSSHLRNIVSMLPAVDQDSLVLLDELGAGTDPAEGAALARALLLRLLESQAKAVVTTHYSELKTFAHEEEGVENASVEFNVETLSPTYRLTIGLPGRSQALAIAKRLGMPQTVLNLARESVATGEARVERLLAQIQAERRHISQLFQRAKEIHEDAAKIRDRIRDELKAIKDQREQVLEQARQEGAGVVRELRARLRDIEEQSKTVASKRAQKETSAQIEVAQSEAASALGPVAPSSDASAKPALTPLAVGDTVSVLSLGQQGHVLAVDGVEAEVQIGLFKMRVPVDDLERLSRKERETQRTVEYVGTREAPPLEIDVRGWRADEAMRELDQYIHDNFMHGQGTVRIVHGKGTGALRKAIRDQLQEHPLVKSVQAEKSELGGEGVTVAQLSLK